MKAFIIDHTNIQQALDTRTISQPAAPANWYTTSTAEDTQGLIYNEKTGQNIAVSYNPEHAAIIAAAPKLLDACKLAYIHLRECNDCEENAANHGAEAIAAIEKAIRKANG